MGGYDRLLADAERRLKQREAAIRNQFRVLIEIPFERQASADLAWDGALIENDLARHRSGQGANLTWFDGYQALPHLLISSVGVSDEEFEGFFPFEEIDFQPAGIVNPHAIAWHEAVSFALDCVKKGFIAAYGYFDNAERFSRLDPEWFGRDQRARVAGFSDTWFLPNLNRSPDHPQATQKGEASTDWKVVAAQSDEWNSRRAKNVGFVRMAVTMVMEGKQPNATAAAWALVEQHGRAPQGQATNGMIVSASPDVASELAKRANKILNSLYEKGYSRKLPDLS